MPAKEILSSEEFGKCVEFHGHVCPGVAIGFQAARVLMELLGVGRAPDEELVGTVETDACGVDAIQVMTGCTFGKENTSCSKTMESTPFHWRTERKAKPCACVSDPLCYQLTRNIFPCSKRSEPSRRHRNK